MRRDRIVTGLWLAAGVLVAASCGTARSTKSAEEPKAPSQAGYAQPPQPGATGSANKLESSAEATPTVQSAPAEPPPAAAPAPAAPRAAPAPESAEDKEAPRAADPRGGYARARVQLADARRRLDIAATQRDCANACRALDSMERAAVQLCELAQSSEERDTCRSAEDQLGTARQKVKSACGVCPKTK